MKAEGWEGVRERDWRCRGKMDEAGGARPQERGRGSARAGQAGGQGRPEGLPGSGAGLGPGGGAGRRRG